MTIIDKLENELAKGSKEITININSFIDLLDYIKDHPLNPNGLYGDFYIEGDYVFGITDIALIKHGHFGNYKDAKIYVRPEGI